MYSTIALISLAASLAIATPIADNSNTFADSPSSGDKNCGNNQTTLCCNSGSGTDSGSGGILGGLLGGLLGGGCELPLLGQQCPSQTLCCDSNQSGLINIGTPCIPLDL